MGDELLFHTIHRLKAAGVEHPRLEAQILLSKLLAISRTKAAAGLIPPLSEKNRFELENLIQRRTLRCPLPYLIGESEFYSLSFTVTRETLIPRPETELLVDWGLGVIKERGKVMAADVGTGSGCIITSLLVNAPEAQGLAIDISLTSLLVAMSNASRHGVKDRINFIQGDLLSQNAQEQFDLILSNPPYIPSLDIETLEPEVRVYEPRLALDGGPDGLDFYRKLITQSLGALRQGGWLGVEVGIEQANLVRDLFKSERFSNIEIHNDLGGIPRIVCAQRNDTSCA